MCQIVHSTPGVDASQCPAHTSNNSSLLSVAFGVSFVVLAVGIYLLLIPIKSSEKVKVDTSKLDETEKKIYNLLQNHQGSMYQSDLLKEMELSKVQLTRILDKLETKKIMDRKRRGMANLIILK